EMARCVRCRTAIQRAGELDLHSVAMNMKTNRQLHLTTAEPYALQTAVVELVIAPTGRPGHIQLAILRAESTAMRAGTKLAGQRNDRPLLSAVDFVPQHQKMS